MKVDAPEISVVIPNFNREKTIERAIESVIQQDFKNWELIVIDDCSTDNSFKLIRDYCHKDNRIRSFKFLNNKGVAAARNLGINKAQSSYVSMLDSDDWYEKSFLSKSLLKIKNTPESIGFIWTGAIIINSWGKKFISWSNNYPFNSYVNFLHSLHIGAATGTTFKTEIFNKVGYFRENLPAAEDTDFFLRVSKSYDYDNITEFLINIDKREKDRMSTNFENIAIAYNMFLPEHFETIRKFPALEKKYYYKMMWLNYYLKNKKEARKYLEFLRVKSKLNLKSLFVFFVFEILPFKIAEAIHQMPKKFLKAFINS